MSVCCYPGCPEVGVWLPHVLSAQEENRESVELDSFMVER